MNLVIGDQTIPVRFDFRETIRSPHTRRELRTGTIRFRILDAELQPAVDEAVTAARSEPALIVQTDDGTTIAVKVVSSSSSSTNWRPPWDYTLEVSEVESLKPESLWLDGVELTPYLYEESPDGDGITALCKVEVDRTAGERIVVKLREYSGGSYFPVIRRGLEETPRKMRFGQCSWSEHGTTLKYELVLVEEAAEYANKGLPLVAEMSNVMRQVARNSSTLDSLTSALVESGALTPGQAESIREKALREEWDRVWALFRLRDIDR